MTVKCCILISYILLYTVPLSCNFLFWLSRLVIFDASVDLISEVALGLTDDVVEYSVKQSESGLPLLLALHEDTDEHPAPLHLDDSVQL